MFRSGYARSDRYLRFCFGSFPPRVCAPLAITFISWLTWKSSESPPWSGCCVVIFLHQTEGNGPISAKEQLTSSSPEA
jgi:hypothetical protein